MIELCFDIDRPLWLTSNQRMGWWEKARRSRLLREYAGWLGASVARRPMFDRCEVEALIAYPSSRRADPANASPTVKALIDGLTDAGYWPDDDSKHVTAVTYRRDPEKSRRGTYKVTLRIKGVADA